ncbi:NAD(P)-dependent oxidoreductase [Accumulibacter sp.]|uniref:NAD(P)-dependent oxidoreductase n=1 Tax=Accumulibacter sp. TaxID=2053492 RepID=UPI0026135991|nr:NAD(P)H-binding protein [Accumulibacter sp.]
MWAGNVFKLHWSGGHQVLALSRGPDALPKGAAITRIRSSATRTDDLQRAVDGAEAILVCLGTGMSTKPTTLYSDFGRALLEIQPEIGDTPVLVLTGFGASESGIYHGPLMGLLFRFVLKEVYEDKTRLEQMIEQSRLNWMFIRPGLLTNGPSGPFRVHVKYHKGLKVGRIPRRSVAEFMVSQAEAPTYMRQKPALSAR